jgi:hypothetical protein
MTHVYNALAVFGFGPKQARSEQREAPRSEARPGISEQAERILASWREKMRFPLGIDRQVMYEDAIRAGLANGSLIVDETGQNIRFNDDQRRQMLPDFWYQGTVRTPNAAEALLFGKDRALLKRGNLTRDRSYAESYQGPEKLVLEFDFSADRFLALKYFRQPFDPSVDIARHIPLSLLSEKCKKDLISKIKNWTSERIGIAAESLGLTSGQVEDFLRTKPSETVESRSEARELSPIDFMVALKKQPGAIYEAEMHDGTAEQWPESVRFGADSRRQFIFSRYEINPLTWEKLSSNNFNFYVGDRQRKEVYFDLFQNSDMGVYFNPAGKATPVWSKEAPGKPSVVLDEQPYRISADASSVTGFESAGPMQLTVYVKPDALNVIRAKYNKLEFVIPAAQGEQIMVRFVQARSEARATPAGVKDAAEVRDLAQQINSGLAHLTGVKPIARAEARTLVITTRGMGDVVVSNVIGARIDKDNFVVKHWDSARSEIRTDMLPLVLPIKVPNDRPQITLDEYRAMVAISKIIPQDQIQTLKETAFSALSQMKITGHENLSPAMVVAVAVTYGIVSNDKENIKAVAPLLMQMAMLIDSASFKGVVAAMQKAVPAGIKIPITLETGHPVMILDRLRDPRDAEALLAAIKFNFLLHPNVTQHVFVRDLDSSAMVTTTLKDIKRWLKALNHSENAVHMEVATKGRDSQQSDFEKFLRVIGRKAFVVLGTETALAGLSFGNAIQIRVDSDVWRKAGNRPIVMDITSRAAQLNAEALDKQAADLGLFGKGRQFMINANSILMLQNLQALYEAFQTIQAAA